MKHIAILTGGDSEERIISLKSGQVVFDHLAADRYRCFQIDINGSHWSHIESGTPIDKNNFSLSLNGETILFDCVFAALHGSPLENGKLQGYFDILGIPYTCCDGYVSALTMSKHFTKMQLASLGIPMANGILLHKNQSINLLTLENMGLPLFVKPNTHGSSFGVSKVKSKEQLLPAIENAFQFDNEVLVEAFMPGREFSNGVLRINNEIVVLPVTEIIPDDEFFTYEAKYEGRSKEVTPAEISPAHRTQIQNRTKQIYEALGCKGVVRIDYILVEDTFYLLEVNTIPGISPASIVPQQAKEYGWSLDHFFSLLIEEAIKSIPQS